MAGDFVDVVRSGGIDMSRLTKAWADDKRMSRKQRRAASGRKAKLDRLIAIQSREMKFENLNRICGD